MKVVLSRKGFDSQYGGMPSPVLPDGTLLWRSEFIEPGKGVREITLNEPLAAGEYPDTTVRYECFSLDDQSPLNGAVSKTTLHVE